MDRVRFWMCWGMVLGAATMSEACDSNPEHCTGGSAAACAPRDAGSDGGVEDAGGTDAGRGDAAVADGTVPDGSPLDGNAVADAGDAGDPCAACSGERVCVRGACIATCGLDASGIETALAPGLAPIGHACRAVSGPIDLVAATDPARPRVYEVNAHTSGTVTVFRLVRWTFEETPMPEPIGAAMYDAGSTGAMAFIGGYLAVSPDERRALFGYTTSTAGFLGGVFDAEIGRMTVEYQAAGNFDAEWVDGNRWLVNGLAFDGLDNGQGLYLRNEAAGTSRHRVTRMGTNSGSVAVVDDLVIAGGFTGFGSTWPDGSEGGRLFVFDRAAVIGDGPPIPAWDEARARLEGPSVFELLSGMRLAYVTYDPMTYGVTGIEARRLTAMGRTFALGAAQPIASGPTFTAIAAGDAGTFALVHAGGVLLVRSD